MEYQRFTSYFFSSLFLPLIVHNLLKFKEIDVFPSVGENISFSSQVGIICASYLLDFKRISETQTQFVSRENVVVEFVSSSSEKKFKENKQVRGEKNFHPKLLQRTIMRVCCNDTSLSVWSVQIYSITINLVLALVRNKELIVENRSSIIILKI